MKKTVTLWVAALALALFTAGCGQESADRPLEEIKAEAQKLDAGQLQHAIDNCKKELAKLEPEAEALKKQIAELKVTELAGEKASQLKAELAKLGAKMDNLGEQLKVYAEAAAAKVEGK